MDVTVVCNERNNSAEDIQQGQLTVDLRPYPGSHLYNVMMQALQQGHAYLDETSGFHFTEEYLNSLDEFGGTDERP